MAKPVPKTISAEAAAALVRSGDWVDYGTNVGQPDLFDRALGARAQELRGVKIRSCLTLRPRAVLEADPEGEHFSWLSWHFSGYDRGHHDAGRSNYVPMNFGEAPDYYRRFVDPIDVVCLKTAPMDEHGFFNFGAAVTYHKAVTERARLLVVETSPAMPYVYGGEESVHASEVDYVIEGPDEALPELANPPPTDVDRQVAALIAAEIEDGACLQIGIGGMPNAVCASLKDAGVKDLGIHTEMFVDGMIELVEAGLVTGARKKLNPYQSTFTFALGSRKVYDFIHRNPRVQSFPVDYTNLPHHIMQNDKVVSINNTTQVDLQGQAASESDGHRRPAPVRARRLRLAGRQVVHLPVLHLREARCPPQPDRRGAHRGQRRHDAAHRRHVRLHRVRPREPEGEVGGRAREGADRHRAPRLPRRPRARGAREEPDPEGLLLSARSGRRAGAGQRPRASRAARTRSARASGR
jgi:acyl-CoA hydrolase